MIGLGNEPTDDGGALLLQTARVVQVTPARHDDQHYRFKWEIPSSVEFNKPRSGWTNETQRVNARTAKCDDRFDTHASFDFVRNCDLKDLTKQEEFNQLYQELRDVPMLECAAKYPECCVECEKEIAPHQTVIVMPCCFKRGHQACVELVTKAMQRPVQDVQPKTMHTTKKATSHVAGVAADQKGESTTTESTTTAATTTATAHKYTGMLCPYCHIHQPRGGKQKDAHVLHRAKLGHLYCTYKLAKRYVSTSSKQPHNTLDVLMGEMLLTKVAHSPFHGGFCKADALHTLGMLTWHAQIKTSCLDAKKKMCETYWRSAVAVFDEGYLPSQQALDQFFPSAEMLESIQKEEKRKLIEMQRQIARGEIQAPQFKRGVSNGKDEGIRCPSNHALVQFMTPVSVVIFGTGHWLIFKPHEPHFFLLHFHNFFLSTHFE